MRTFVFGSLMLLTALGLAARTSSAQELDPPAVDAAQQADTQQAVTQPSETPVYQDPNVDPAGCAACTLGDVVLAAPNWDGFGGYTPASYSQPSYGGEYVQGGYDPGMEYSYGGPPAIPPDPKGGAWHSKCPIMWSFRADAMVLERDDVRDQTIVVNDRGTPANVNALDDVPLLGTGDISFNYDTSARVALTSQRQWNVSWELAYFGLYEWDRFVPVIARNSLAVPFDTDFSTEFDDADLITVQYVSEIHNAEFNRRHHITPDAKILLGFRYFNLNERFSIEAFDRSFTGGAVFDGAYHTDTDNHMGGFQIGAEATQCCKLFSFTGGVKGGIYNNYIEKHVNLQGTPNIFMNPPFLLQLQDSGSQVAFLGEAYFEGSVQIRKHLVGQLGWRVLFVDGVALAPEQFDSALTPTSTSTPLNHSGSVMYNGGYGGFTVFW